MPKGYSTDKEEQEAYKEGLEAAQQGRTNYNPYPLIKSALLSPGASAANDLYYAFRDSYYEGLIEGEINVLRQTRKDLSRS